MMIDAVRFRFVFVLLCGFCLLYGTLPATAQASGSKSVSVNLPEVALLDIEPNNTGISLSFSAPSEAGMPVTPPTANTSKWLNYTSALASSASARHVSAAIDQMIPGVSIRVQAGPAVGGGGALGTSTGAVSVTTVPQTIVSGIGGAFTGDGANNGHQLSIWAEISDYNVVTQITGQFVTITYTISN